jgi:hypothetical protein
MKEFEGTLPTTICWIGFSESYRSYIGSTASMISTTLWILVIGHLSILKRFHELAQKN